MNMSRMGKYSEKSYRLHFERPFDFSAFNRSSAEQCCSGHRIIAGDCGYISKSGKKTPHPAWFWNGCASKALNGLEISSLAVVDVDNNTAPLIKIFSVHKIRCIFGDREFIGDKQFYFVRLEKYVSFSLKYA
ncbi:hypothetical protein QUF90_00945 [Desulfococcaceae bacterium HSG9]|nr:hypothetical protein [Desulfococcaceae bacterium HSG9]